MKSCPMVTVLTPTYNRVNTLRRLMNSLCMQTQKNFQWLVIDDGSSDGTEEFFKEIGNKLLPFEWEYHKKENGGKHTALNYSHPYIKGEIVLILDSDDYLTKTAIETLEIEWPKYRDRQDICGMSYFKGESEDMHLSINNPQDFFIADHIHYRVNQSIKGDHCEIIRTDILKNNPFPVYKDEKFMAESWLWNRVGMSYKTVYRNKTIYICQYLPGGLTEKGRTLRMKCPLGMMEDCRTYLNNEVCLKVRIKEMLLYWVYAKCAQYSCVKTVKTSGRPLGMIATALPGLLLYRMWQEKYL